MVDRKLLLQEIENGEHDFLKIDGMLKTVILPVETVKELLKEQEPLIIRMEVVDEIYDYIAECPECGMAWAMWQPEKMRFCPGCGKAVKWDGS